MNGIPHNDAVTRIVGRALDSGEGITVLTGAGVSAESGVPTFRGSEGYWTVGSRNYQLTDEYYDEQHYRFNSALLAASRTAFLIVVGTAGVTTLPHHVVTTVVERGGTLIDINIAPNVFSESARKSDGGVFLQGKSGDILPALADLMKS